MWVPVVPSRGNWPPADAGESGRIFAQLAEVIYSGDQVGHAYQAVCDAAVLVVDGCDHASVMIRRPKGPVTRASTDPVARTVDELERQVSAGPCVDALVDESPQLAPDLTRPDGPWPRLRREVVARTPVRGMLGFRLAPAGRKLGALNLFSDRPHGFTADTVSQATILVAFCSVAIRADDARQDVHSLRQGLEFNREIGKAIGLLMAFHQIDDEDAFQILRTTSNQLNMKLGVVAEQIVRGHHEQFGRP